MEKRDCKRCGGSGEIDPAGRGATPYQCPSCTWGGFLKARVLGSLFAAFFVAFFVWAFISEKETFHAFWIAAAVWFFIGAASDGVFGKIER